MDRLAMRLLGGMEIRLDDGPFSPLEAGKTSALLAYLAVEAAHPHSRQILAEFLWPERENIKALAALRYALSNLHTVLHDRDAAVPYLLIDRSSVQLNPQAELWVDAVAFREQAAALCERAAALCERGSAADAAPSVTSLQEVLALYQGPFLHGLNLGDSLNFESWALRTREQLEHQRLRVLDLLGTAQEAAGDHGGAAESYRTILETWPWDEDAHRSLMRALAADGERGAALAQYAICCQALGELGIEPESATQALYQQIRQASGAGFAGTEPLAVPFVARERELERLSIAQERALAGHGQVVWITGEAGSGKTALLSAAARQALDRHPDLLVVGGRCDAYAGVGWPYQPFIEGVQMLTGEWETLPCAGSLPLEAQKRLRQAAPQIAQVLAETAPDVLARFVDHTALARRVPAQDRSIRQSPARRNTQQNGASHTPPKELGAGRVFEQIAGLFASLARRRPLMLLLDDLQWIDADSAALLFHLARRSDHSRLLLVAAYRPGEIVSHREETDPHPLLGVVTELQRYGGDSRVDLDQADERAFVTAFLEQDPLLHPNRLDAAFCTALARRTGGNPLFTIELLRSLQARNDIRRATDGNWVNSPTLDWEHLPERVEAAIAGNIARLPAEWRDWLTTASVEGESFTAEVLARVHSVDIDTLLRVLGGPLGLGRGGRRLVQAEGAQWLAACDPPQCLSRYRFRHSLFQVYLYRQLNPVERARRHAAVGFALETLYCSQPEARARRASELARHFEIGGLLEKAAVYHLEAGRQAAYLASPQSAVDHYRRGLALLAEQPHAPARDRLEIRLYLALGVPFLSASGWGGPERQSAIQQALTLLQATGPVDTHQPDPDWYPLVLALYAHADWLISRGELQQAVRIGEQILTLAGEPTSLSHALAHRVLGMSALFRGDFPEARRQFEDVLDIYHTLGQPATLPQIGADLGAACQVMLGYVLAASGYLDRAQALTSQALARARHVQHPSTLGIVLIFACEVAVLRGDLSALNALAEELLRVGQAEGLRFFLAYGWAAAGHVRAHQAQPGSEREEAKPDLVQRGKKLWESTGTQMGRGMWIVRQADAYLQAGNIAAGLAITTDALAMPGIAASRAQIHRLHGALLLCQTPPDRSAAEACFEKALEIARRQGAHTLELHAAFSLAQLWHASQPEAARRLLADTYAWFTEGLDTPDLVAVREWLARHAQRRRPRAPLVPPQCHPKRRKADA